MAPYSVCQLAPIRKVKQLGGTHFTPRDGHTTQTQTHTPSGNKQQVVVLQMMAFVTNAPKCMHCLIIDAKIPDLVVVSVGRSLLPTETRY